MTGKEQLRTMPSPAPATDHDDARARVLALLRAATAAFPGQPTAAGAWLHAPHARLLGATPAAAAWYSGRLAALATSILDDDARRQSFNPGRPADLTKLPSTNFH